jgi:hypothetical protein
MRASGTASLNNEKNQENLMTEKILDSLQKKENYGDILAQQIYKSFECIRLIRIFLKFQNPEGIFPEKGAVIFSRLYRNEWERLYMTFGILLDRRPDSIGFPTFMKFCEAENSWSDIEKLEICKKIYTWRSKMTAHFDKMLALNEKKKIKFYNENKLHIDELDEFLHLLVKILKKVMEKCGSQLSFYCLPGGQICEELQNLIESSL